MAKKRRDAFHKEFLQNFKDETLAILQREVGEGKEKKTVHIAIVNDYAFPDVAEKASAFVVGKELSVLALSGLWQAFYDAKHSLIADLLGSKVVHDSGLIDALRAAVALNQGVMKKFDRYLMSTILFGSWARGTAAKGSDIDVALVIDDTDVKETTRVEIKEKLRRIALGLAAEISRKFNVQVYILTQFWEYVRDANPVIFTILRDGIPIYDKGLFLPWKLLLRMGKIKPTPEAIESFIASSKMLISNVQSSINDAVAERLYYAMLNPAQAALMFIGLPPPVHKETPALLRKYFVDKGMLDGKYVDWLEEVVDLRKQLEHGEPPKIDGKLLDTYVARAKQFSDTVNKLFEKLKREQIGEKLKEIDYMFKKGMRDVLDVLGVKASEKDLVSMFMSEVVNKKVIPHNYGEIVNYFLAIQDSYSRGLVAQEEISKLERDAHDFIETLIGFVKVQELKGTDKFKVRCSYGSKTAELWFLGDEVYIVKDVSRPESEVYVAHIRKDGSIGSLEKTDISELTEKRSKLKIPKMAAVKEKTLESLKEIFGKEVRIILAK
jgi:predicted nucleotidyltransferase/uncharacterized protein (UPF0332 family)